ncbi:MAG: phosphoenolpyruvate carboxylase [Saprospiraceae bacterium]|nr:phosphoenolpyruvate carboxylase [Saprospiraceae bacterium]
MPTMNFDSPIALPYHTFNSLFLSLPFRGIEETGTHLALFGQACKEGFAEGKSPEQIVEQYWAEYFEKLPATERISLLFYFIQYVERQVVLFDSVEDALFESTHDLNGVGSVNHLLLRLRTDAERKKLLQKLGAFQVRLVLTAHPTQFYPGKVLGIINDLGLEIRSSNLAQIRLLLMQLGKTTFINRQKPTPLDEAISLGWYLENVFYNTLPETLFRLLQALGQDATTFENPHLLALGFWPGGDRDGNPNVTAEITLSVAARMREGILRRYYHDIRQLKRRLTFSGTEDWMAAAERKVHNTLYYPEQETYASCQELISDLLEARHILIRDHQALFLDELDRVILKVRIFGFYFSSIDIRQDSRKHDEVWQAILQNWSEKFPWFDIREFQQADEHTKINRLLTTKFLLDENDYTDAFVKETIRSFRAIYTIQKNNGELGCHRYVISNCKSALHVAEVLALARLTSEGRPAKSEENDPAGADRLPNTIDLDIVPLFETIEDLADAGRVMTTLYTNEHYARHLAGRSKRQTIMLGFSDGTKDGGYLRANWSIYRAKEELTRVSREHGISVVFFDGRGGPPGRGGGNNANYYAAHGADIENREIHVTIQGQTVSSTYGTPASARFNIERLLTAGLENHLFESHARELTEADRGLMDELADAAFRAYLELKNHPEFVPYLEKITPLNWYGDSNIASRPTKRGTAAGLKFEDLRAIPFVGAWAQMKQNIPGYYGFGAALEALEGAGKQAALQELYGRSLFLRTLVENSMQSLSKSNFEVTRYLTKHPRFQAFWQLLLAEYERSGEKLLELAGQKAMLADNPSSRTSIALREDIVLPLIAIQQFALQKLQDGALSPDQAEVFRKMVLRAMFGIINAARNAA